MEHSHIEDINHLPGIDTVILFVHGIHGSPSQFEYLVDAFKNRYAIANILLPGHGQTMKIFAKSSMQEWQNYVSGHISSLEKEYTNIIYVGHSMGCLLGISAARSRSSVKGMLLIAPPLVIRANGRYVKNSLIIGLTNKTPNAYVAEARKANSVFVRSPFDYALGGERYIELLKKARECRTIARDLKMPLTLVHSDEDEIVSVKSLAYFSGMNNTQTIILPNAGHYYYPPEAKVKITEALSALIKRACLEKHAFIN